MAIRLSVEDLRAVMKVLVEGNKPLEQLGSQFHRSYPRKFEQFRVGVGICSLMEDANTELLMGWQRLAALYILYDLYKVDQVCNNPFCLLFVYILRGREANIEKVFVQYLLRENVRDISKICPRELPSSSFLQSPPSPLTKEEVDGIIRKYYRGNPGRSSLQRAEASPLLETYPENINSILLDGSDPSSPSPSTSPNSPNPSNSNSPNSKKPTPPYHSATNLGPLTPVLVRPFPSVLAPLPSEIQWINPSATLPPVWDNGMCSSTTPNTTVRELVEKAWEAPLLPSDHQKLLELFERYPNLVKRCGMSPSKLPRLVESNPNIAIAFLTNLLSFDSPSTTSDSSSSPRSCTPPPTASPSPSSSPSSSSSSSSPPSPSSSSPSSPSPSFPPSPSASINDYLPMLIGMNITLHCMEVVSGLLPCKNFPLPTLHRFIANCMASCNYITEKFAQKRQVLLVCSFLHSLLRNESVDVSSMLTEMCTFCMDYSRIKEASNLYRVLKKIEQENKVAK